MSSKTSDHAGTIQNDREYYAELWGIKSQAALSRDAWRGLRRRCALIAVFTLAALAAYLLVAPAFRRPPGADAGHRCGRQQCPTPPAEG